VPTLKAADQLLLAHHVGGLLPGVPCWGFAPYQTTPPASGASELGRRGDAPHLKSAVSAPFVARQGREHQGEAQLIALMVLCCDPLAIALTAAASVRR
jgi:hypothetical protein